MKPTRILSLILTAASAVCLAQPPQNGGWRRATDPPPTPVPTQEATVDPAQVDPTQPVARADEYGQPQTSPPRQPQSQPRNLPPDDRPQAGMAYQRYGLPPQLTVPAGTFVTVRMNQGLSSDRNQEGDIFSATLAQPVVVDGIVVAQRGQNVMGRVAEAIKAGRAQGTSRLALQLTGLTLADGSQMNIQSQLVNRNGRPDVGRDVATVATTTAVGATIGAAADWGRGAAIGAGAGAAAGVIGVLLTRGHPTIIYPETVLTFRVDTPVVVNTTRAPQAFRYVGPDEYDRPVSGPVTRPYDPYYAPYPYPSPYYYPYYPYYGGIGFGVVVRGRWHRW